jgi:hypothetical protein
MASLNITALHRFQGHIPFISHQRNVQFYTVCISFNESSQQLILLGLQASTTFHTAN